MASSKSILLQFEDLIHGRRHSLSATARYYSDSSHFDTIVP
jgi:hypothetical protein